MSALILSSQVPEGFPQSQVLYQQKNSTKNHALQIVTLYSGPFVLNFQSDGKPIVIHTPDTSVFPNYVGKTLIRSVTFEDGRLILRGTLGTTGQEGVVEWIR